MEAAELYEKGKAKAGGLSDPHMGTMDKFGGICLTDGAGMHDCPGYFGHIELGEPVYHCERLLAQAGAFAAAHEQQQQQQLKPHGKVVQQHSSSSSIPAALQASCSNRSKHASHSQSAVGLQQLLERR